MKRITVQLAAGLTSEALLLPEPVLISTYEVESDKYVVKLCEAAIFTEENHKCLLGVNWINYDGASLDAFETSRVEQQRACLNAPALRSIFKQSADEVTFANLAEVEMGYTDTKRMKKIYHKLNPARMEQLRRAHADAMKAGYVEEMPAKWLERRTPMPVVLPPKGDGSSRFCLNGSQLKDFTEVIPQDISPLVALRSIPRASSFFFSADLTAYYYQIPVTEEQATHQCYELDGKVYYFRSVMMGARNGNSVAHHTLERLLGTIARPPETHIVNYVDDVVGSASSTEGLSAVRDGFLETCVRYNLQLSPWKFLALARRVHFLSWRVTGTCNQPGFKYKKVLKTAKTQKECETVIFSMQYFAPSVPQLKRCLDQARAHVQAKELPEALGVLRQAADMLSEVQVARIDHDDVMDVFTDWSKEAVGVVVVVNGMPFLAASIKNSKLMAAMPAPLGELIGIGLALLKFDFFVKNHRLRLHVDAQAAVKGINNFTVGGREHNYVRYILLVLLRYDVSYLGHVKGSENPSDCFSRVLSPFDVDELLQFSCNSAILEPVVEHLDPVETYRTEDEGKISALNDVKLHVGTYLHTYAHFGLKRTKELRDCLDR
eukprot:GHVH01012811.1.p1 GENE.GHVH01012811.1~~GHVH01012811.1.p1  ORF type:complete len:604 (-),score=62.06 GHVH01012811.1:1624-3435(-)